MMILKSLEFALPTLMPCEVVGAVCSAAEALKAIPKLKPDILWVDMCLPEIDGPNLLRLLKVRGICPARVLFTASEAGALIREAMSVEPEGFVSKADTLKCWQRALEGTSGYLISAERAFSEDKKEAERRNETLPQDRKRRRTIQRD